MTDLTSQKQYILLAPQSPTPNVHIPERFKIALRVHIIKSALPALDSPLILAIQGSPGTGKSFQIREELSRMGVYVVSLSGATISGQHEGEALAILMGAYRFASTIRASKRAMVALVIDDFDMSVAATAEGRTYTVNSQLVTGMLMNLSDDPSQHSGGLQKTPIILTGNNLCMLHSALMRHGRMNFFEWIPTEEERSEIVKEMMQGLIGTQNQADLQKFIEYTRDEPISFVSAVKDDMVNQIIISHLELHGNLDFDKLQHDINARMARCDLDDLLRAAKLRKQNNKPKNYLNQKKSGWGRK